MVDEITFRSDLLNWYDREKRDLPWRREPSVYKTVVSEFMLQQTQVKTVLPYFEKWMTRFPDFNTLASATEQQVLKLWEGLGYYRRARYLHQVAKSWTTLEKKPETYSAWLKFPGVGPYMAAAVASISANEPVAVVDGNVIRVIIRLQCVETVFKSTSSASRQVQVPAQQLIDPSRPGDFNQAMMELGATVCRPRQPQCLGCPVSTHCGARAAGLETEIPRISKGQTLRVFRPRALVVDRNHEAILLTRESMNGRFVGIYELPILRENGVNGKNPIATIRRAISNEQVTEPVFRISENEWSDLLHKKTEPEWIPFESLAEVPLSGPHRRWLNDFLASGEGSC